MLELASQIGRQVTGDPVLFFKILALAAFLVLTVATINDIWKKARSWKNEKW